MSHGGGLEPADAATTRAYDVQLGSYSGTCGEKSVIPFLNASGLLKSHDVNADISVVYVHSVSSNAARNALLQHGSVITGPARHLMVYMPRLVINWVKCALTMPGCVARSACAVGRWWWWCWQVVPPPHSVDLSDVFAKTSTSPNSVPLSAESQLLINLIYVSLSRY